MPSLRPVTSSAITSLSPTSTCCRSCIESGRRRKARTLWPQRAISPPISTVTRRGPASFEPFRQPARPGGRSRTEAVSGAPREARAETRLNSDEPELGSLALGEFGDGLADDDVLEVVGLLVIGEGCFIGEHLVEEELARLGDVL